jgi:hypothetical protein
MSEDESDSAVLLRTPLEKPQRRADQPELVSKVIANNFR